MTHHTPRPSDAERAAVGALSEEWDREPDAVWEPWQPDIGDLVRVLKISPECEVHALDRPETVAMIGGLRGLVNWIHDDPRFPGHRYHVGFEYVIPARLPSGEPGTMIGGYFAACELELHPADARDEGPD